MNRITWVSRVGVSLTLTAMSIVLGVVAAHASDVAVARCQAADLTARQSDTGAGMSQPFSVITLTNVSGQACTLSGYPTLTRARTASGPKPFTVRNGRLANGPSADPSSFVVPAGGHAWFTLGTATAYDPPLVTFRRVRFTPASSGGISVAVQLPATAPTGKPFPITVTAFATGSHP